MRMLAQNVDRNAPHSLGIRLSYPLPLSQQLLGLSAASQSRLLPIYRPPQQRSKRSLRSRVANRSSCCIMLSSKQKTTTTSGMIRCH